MATVQTVLALATVKHWDIHQLEVNNAFHHGELSEEVYMELPQGHPVHGSGLVCRLIKSIYSLKEASQLWFEKLASVLLDLGSEFISHVKSVYHSTFTIKDLGLAKYYLGHEIHRTTEGLYFHQHKFVHDILLEAVCGEVALPNRSRPDITYVVHHLSHFLQNPRVPHMLAMQCVLRYLKGTPYQGLFYSANTTLKLQAYCDSDWGSTLDSSGMLTSITSMCFTLGSSFVNWLSTKQKVVSRSTAVIELGAVVDTACEVSWFNLL
nr:PREDICTED: uncharacterized mitochondrial protein AtMg00810-like [Daucus carota subsp. sativus]